MHRPIQFGSPPTTFKMIHINLQMHLPGIHPLRLHQKLPNACN